MPKIFLLNSDTQPVKSCGSWGFFFFVGEKMSEAETETKGQKPKTCRLTVKSLVLAISVLLCLAVVLFVLVFPRLMRPRPRIIYTALERHVDKEQAKTVRLADLTDFDWDHLYAFPPYTWEHEVSSVLGEKFVITEERRYRLNNGDVLIVFFNNGKVVYHEFVVPKYRLFGADSSFVIPREKAVFKVKPYSGGGPYELHQTNSQ
jgi:hypothetical protein